MTIHSSHLVVAIALICVPVFASTRTIEIAKVAVEDGDTLIITIDGANERVQLAHIDAPEDTDNPKLQRDIQRTGLGRGILIELGQSATQHLRGLVEEGAKPLVLDYDPENRDRYGRLVGEVIDAGGRSLGAAMVEDGFARVLSVPGPEIPRPAALMVAEANAISSARGLWGMHAESALAWKGSD